MKTIAAVAVLFLLSPLVAAAQTAAPPPSDASAGAPPLMRLADVERGQLMFRTAEPGAYAPAPLVATEVEIEVGGIVARTVVRQHFVNPTDGWLEGRYVFPLPEESAVNRMTLAVGDRVIEARIAERRAARQTYEKARQEGRRAALVEQHRPNVFSNDVANIPPHGRIAVELHYLSRLRYEGGKFSLRFPLVVAPRFDPAQRAATLVRQVPGGPGAPPATRTIPVRDTTRAPPANPVSLAISLDAGVALAAVESPSHAVDIEGTGTGKRRIALTGNAVPADRDFVLSWTPEAAAAPRVASFRERVGDDIYLLAMILPPAADRTTPPPRDVVFILDRSGSMGGKSIRAARAALETALDRLRPDDRFNLIRFSDRTDALFDAVRPANGSAALMAKIFLRATEADGGTVMRPALLRALGEPVPDGRLRQVVFLTDGAVANETELFREIASRLGPARLFTVGIGSAPNGYFMRKAAEAGRGAYVYVSDLDAVESETARLFEKLEIPARTGIEALWSDGGGAALAPETYPGIVPDLYAGEPVALIARLPASALETDAALTLRSGDWTARTALADARPAAGIGALWARAKIMALADSRREGVPEEAVAAAVTEVALKHGLVSRYTSLVATERERVRPEDAALASGDVPLNLPHGWNYEKTMGGALIKRDAMLSPSAAMQQAAIRLPQGATPFWLHLAAGLGLALLAGLALFAARRPQPPAPDPAG